MANQVFPDNASVPLPYGAHNYAAHDHNGHSMDVGNAAIDPACGMSRLQSWPSTTLRMMANIRQDLTFAFNYHAVGLPIAAGVFYRVFGLLILLRAQRMGEAGGQIFDNLNGRHPLSNATSSDPF